MTAATLRSALAVAALAVAAPAAAAAPRPAAPVPTAPAPLARALTTATDELFAALEEQRRRDAALWALYQQRIFLALGLDRGLARGVVARTPPRHRPFVRDVVTARHALVRLTPPTTRPLSSFRTGRAEPPQRLLAYYREAQRRFGVGWHVLAAINFVETGFNKIRSRSSAGAQGPMQFMPATWRAYGLGGDVHDPREAILGAANYLRASGAPGDYRRALFAYNRSPLYVDAVLAYARQIRRDIRVFHSFYNWQVFVRTPSGYRRLTATGLRP